MEGARARIEAALEQARTDSAAPCVLGCARAAPSRVRGGSRSAIPRPRSSASSRSSRATAPWACDGRLAPGVHLVSIGDHFDWGRASRTGGRRALRPAGALLARRPPAGTGDAAPGKSRPRSRRGAGGLRRRGLSGRPGRGRCAVRRSAPKDAAALSRFRRALSRAPDARSRGSRLFDVSRGPATLGGVPSPAPPLLRRRGGARSSFSVTPASPAPTSRPSASTPRRSGIAAVVAGALNATLDAAVDAWTEGTPLTMPGPPPAGKRRARRGARRLPPPAESTPTSRTPRSLRGPAPAALRPSRPAPRPHPGRRPHPRREVPPDPRSLARRRIARTGSMADCAIFGYRRRQVGYRDRPSAGRGARRRDAAVPRRRHELSASATAYELLDLDALDGRAPWLPGGLSRTLHHGVSRSPKRRGAPREAPPLAGSTTPHP